MGVSHFANLHLPNLAAPLGPTAGVTAYTGARMKRKDRNLPCTGSISYPIYEPLWVRTAEGWTLEIGTGHTHRNHPIFLNYGTCCFHYGYTYKTADGSSGAWLFQIPVTSYTGHLFQIAKETAVQWVWRIDGKAMATWQRGGSDGIGVNMGLEVYTPNVTAKCGTIRSIAVRDQNGKWRQDREFYKTIYVTGTPSMFGQYDTGAHEWRTAYTANGDAARLC